MFNTHGPSQQQRSHHNEWEIVIYACDQINPCAIIHYFTNKLQIAYFIFSTLLGQSNLIKVTQVGTCQWAKLYTIYDHTHFEIYLNTCPKIPNFEVVVEAENASSISLARTHK